jgi:hypothetical protein
MSTTRKGRNREALAAAIFNHLLLHLGALSMKPPFNGKGWQWENEVVYSV